MALKTEKYRKYYLKCSNTFLAGCIYAEKVFIRNHILPFAVVNNFPHLRYEWIVCSFQKLFAKQHTFLLFCGTCASLFSLDEGLRYVFQTQSNFGSFWRLMVWNGKVFTNPFSKCASYCHTSKVVIDNFFKYWNGIQNIRFQK